jgi:hypothetical protein
VSALTDLSLNRVGREMIIVQIQVPYLMTTMTPEMNSLVVHFLVLDL